MNIRIDGISETSINISKAFGALYFHGEIYKGNETISLIKSVINANEKEPQNPLVEFLQETHGKFAVIIYCEDRTYIISDSIRSIPIYWRRVANNNLQIATNANELRCDNDTVDPLSKDEILHGCYSLGTNTLIQGIKQTTAASIWVFTEEDEHETRYLWMKSVESCIIDKVLPKLISAYDHAFERLVQYLDGRQAVIPLSGGLDSRLILAILTKKKYHNIVAYTYGKRIKDEVTSSRKIAEHFGAPFIWIPYSNKELHRLYLSGEYDRFLRSTSNYSVSPSLQDWYAIWKIKKDHLVDDDAVIIPGHTPVSTIELSPSELDLQNEFSIADVENIQRRSVRVLWKSLDEGFSDRYSDGIITPSQIDTALGVHEVYDMLRDVNYRERQTKYIAYSAQVYSFYGYDWYMPYWDTEIVLSLQNASREAGKRRAFYFELLDEILPGLTDICPAYGHGREAEHNTLHESSVKESLKRILPHLLMLLRVYRVRRHNNMNLMGYTDLRSVLSAAFHNEYQYLALWSKRAIEELVRDIEENRQYPHM